MSKVIAFLLGMIFALAVVFGAVAACVFVVTPDMVTGGNASDYAGDFGSLSLYGIYDKINKIYKESAGNFYRYKTDEDGNFVLDSNGRKQLEQCSETDGQFLTLGMFCATTGIDLDKIVNTQLPSSVYDVPLMEYFNGGDGVNKALKQIKVSTVPDLINLFATTDENGNKLVSQSLIQKIDEYSVFDILQENGIANVFGDVLLTDVLPKVFPDTKQDGNDLQFALGQTSVGGLISAMSNGGNIFVELKEGGILSEVGSLKLSVFFEEDSELDNALGDVTIASLVTDEGKLAVDNLLDEVKVGTLLGYTYEQEKDGWYKLDESGNKVYADGAIAEIAGLSLKEATNFDTFLNIKLGDILGYKRKEVDVSGYTSVGNLNDVKFKNNNFAILDGDVWYKATLNCSDETHTDIDSHQRSCFVVDWYQLCENTDEHDHTADETVFWDDDKHYVLVDGLFNNVADITIGSLVNDGVNGLMSAVKNTKLGQLGIELPDMLKSFADMTVEQLMQDGALDNIYIGEILGYTRNTIDEVQLATYTQTTTDGKVLYYTDGNGTTHYAKVISDKEYAEATLTCTDETTEHQHSTDCFGYVWYVYCNDRNHDEQAHKNNGEILVDGIYAKKVDGLYSLFAGFTVGQLTSGDDSLTDKLSDIKLNQLIDQTTLNGNPLLKNFADKTIRQLTDSDTINGLYLGQVFDGFTRQEISSNELAQYTIAKYGQTTADGGQVTIVYANAAGNLVRKNSVNDDIWYKAKFSCTDPDNAEHVCDMKCYPFVWSKGGTEQTEGMQAKLASYTIADLNDLDGTVNQMTLRDVLGNDVPTQFDAIADEKIGNLQNAVQTLMLGNVMNYTNLPVYDGTFTAYKDSTVLFTHDNGSGTKAIVKKVGDKYYKTTTICNHTESSQHTDDCYFVFWTDENGSALSGIMAKIAEKQISQLGDLQSYVNGMTLGDVMQDNIPQALASLKDTRIDQLGTAIDNMYVGEMLESYYKKSTIIPDGTTDCAVTSDGTTLLYVKQLGEKVFVSQNNSDWYEGTSYCTENEQSHAHDYKCFGFSWYTDITCQNSAIGAMARIANLPVGKLGNANEVFDQLTLADVMGQDKVPDMLKSIQSTKISELGTAVNNLLVGDALNASRTEISQADKENYTTVVVADTVLKNANGEFALKVADKWYVAEQTCTDDTTTHTHESDCFRLVWTKTDGTKLDGVAAAIADLKISQLGDGAKLNDKIQNLTLKDVLTIDASNKLMSALADCKIGEIGSKVQTLKLGDVVDCTEKPLSSLKDTPINEIGTKFNTLKLSEVVDTSSSKVLQALADTPVNELGTAANNLTLGNVIDIDENSNPILQQLQNTKISEIGSAVNDIKTGVAMGYEEIAPGACTATGHSADKHWHDKDGKEVKGIYKKIADNTLNDMSEGGMNTVMKGLTMGDLYDSGVLTLESDDQYALAILVGCNDFFTESTVNYTCNLSDYMTYKATHTGTTAKVFFEKTHSGKTDVETEECLNNWKNIEVATFITSILSALK